MSDVLARLEAIKRQQADAERARVMREAELKAAQNALRASADALKKEFGVSTVAEAREALVKLKAEVEAELADIEAMLAKEGPDG